MLPYFDHMHRYLIALMLREGYEVRFVPVEPPAARRGALEIRRLGPGCLSASRDIMGVMWLKRRFRGPAEIKEL